MAAAFGGGGEELAFQDFAAGESALTPDEIKKLKTMVQAGQLPQPEPQTLRQLRHGDRHLCAQALETRDPVRRTVWEVKRATDPNIAPPAGFFKRVVGTVMFQAKHEERAAVQENTKLSAEHVQAVAATLPAGPYSRR